MHKEIDDFTVGDIVVLTSNGPGQRGTKGALPRNTLFVIIEISSSQGWFRLKDENHIRFYPFAFNRVIDASKLELAIYDLSE